MKLSKNAQLLLCQYLAYCESPWLLRPLDLATACRLAAPAYARRKRPDTPQAISEVSKQTASDCRKSLERAGYISGGRISPRGKVLARTWCYACPGLLAGATARLCDSVADGHFIEHPGGRLCVPSTFIVGDLHGGLNYLLDAVLLPLICDGHVIRKEGLARNCPAAYALGDPDCDISAFIAGVVDYALLPDNWSEDLANSWCDTYNAALTESWSIIERDDTSYSELGDCPCSSRPVESGRDTHDIDGISPLFDEEATDNE